MGGVLRKGTTASAGEDDLAAQVRRLPVQPGVAMRLLWMLDDPRTSAADLGRVVESDPSLSARVLHLANAPSYGLSGQVSSAWRAVSVVGLGTVRTLATTAAFDLFADRDPAIPEGYWSHSVTTAAAAAVLARRVGIPADDALSAGLLHDVGLALMYRRGPLRYEEGVRQRVVRDQRLSILEAEREEYGMTHAETGASALALMRFPDDLVDAVGSHHRDVSEARSALGRLVITAESLAAHVNGGGPGEHASIPDAVRALDLPASAVETLLEEVRQDRAHLAAFLNVR